MAAQVTEEEEMEMKVRMRQAQRRMKGVKLQYTDDDRVTFDDVAGIGPAKVRAARAPPPCAGRQAVFPSGGDGGAGGAMLERCRAERAPSCLGPGAG